MMASRRRSRRGPLRALLAATAAAVLAMSGAVSAAADEPDPATTITGTVTREDGGAPVGQVQVLIHSADFTRSDSGETDENGDYSVAGLEPGEYIVRFVPYVPQAGLLSEYWDGARSLDTAQRVTAVGGETVSGIDASLQASGSMSGRVTRESDGAPVSGVSVTLSSTSLSAPSGSAITDEDGVYLIDGLVPAEYAVRFDAPEGTLVDEYWDGARDQQSATLVNVTAGQIAGGIDASLADEPVVERIGFEGTVTKAEDGSPVPGYVTAFVDGTGSFSTLIQPDGSYELLVPPGVYYLQFVSSDPRILSEYLEDAYTLGDASPSVVATNGGMFEFNPKLETGRAISGVVRADGEPLADAVVETLVYGQASGGMAYTDQDGRYEIIVPPGDYTVRAHGTAYDPIYAWQYFDGADAPAQATVISHGLSVDRTGVDFDLSTGGAVQGSISAEDGEVSPAGAEVTAYLWSEGQWTSVASVNTRGEFALGGSLEGPAVAGGLLPAGTYTIGIGADGYCQTFLGGAATADAAETFDLAGGEIVTGLELTLTADCGTNPPEPTPTLSLGAASVRAGEDVTVSGTGFAPGETISFELRSDPIALGALTADAQGALTGGFRIPASAPVGAHTIVALNAQSVVVASASLQVTAASGTGSGSGTGGHLADTGSEAPVGAMLTAFALVVFGTLLVRRRRIES